ncbi:MAG: hypothetical protein AAF467_24520 [Actinomycetota bacterium]
MAVASTLAPNLAPADRAATPHYLLGAALPDMAAMAGLRLVARPEPGALASGVAAHHRTDDVFHAHPWFTTRNTALVHVMRDAGVPRGAARACAHVGIELLLDGSLLGDEPLQRAVHDAFDAIDDLGDELAELVVPKRRDRWLVHLNRFPRNSLPADHADPDAVAQTLARILARRPRLQLPPELVSTVAAALGDVAADIATTGPDLCADVAETVGATLPGGA